MKTKKLSLLQLSAALLVAIFPINKVLAEFTSLDQVVAIVEEGVILESELQKRIDSITINLKNNNQIVPGKDRLKKDMLDKLILESIQLQLANKNGIRVDDNSLHSTMGKIAKQNNKSLSEFEKMVEEEGLSYEDLRGKIRRDLIMSRLQQKVISNRISITAQDVKNYLSSNEGKTNLSASYRLGHILIAKDNDINIAKSKSDELMKKLNTGGDFQKLATQLGQNADLGWRKSDELPTMFHDKVIEMEIGELSIPIKSESGYHLLKLLDKKGGDHKIVQQTNVRHILIKPNEIRTQEDAHQMILDIREQIMGEKSFKAMARTYSEDPVSATEGGTLGWSNPGDFVSQFETVMNQTKLNEISEPFLSNFGWHILQVEGRRNQNIGKEFQTNQARSILQNEQFDEELALWLREIRQDAFVEIKTN